MARDKRELAPPDDALTDKNSAEMVRAWSAHGGLHVSLRAGVWKDPGIVGIFLADLLGHYVNAYNELEGLDKAETKRRIRQLFDAELDRPTDEPKGGIVK